MIPTPSRRALLGAFAVACAAAAQYQAPRDGAPTRVIVATLLAIAAAAIALPSPIDTGTFQSGADASPNDVRPSHPRRTRWTVLPLAITAVPAALLWDQQPFRATHTFATIGSSWAALLWLGGILAALLISWRDMHGAHSREAARPEPRLHPARLLQGSTASTPVSLPRPRRPGLLSAKPLEAALLASILALALVLRTWHLASLPYGVWFDEVDSAANARALLHLPFQPYAPGNYGHNPSLYFYLLATLIRLEGNGIGTIRLASALFGMLGVLAAYLIGRRVGGPSLGLPAAALIAVAAWSITFSRVGMPDIAVPALVGLGICALCCTMYVPTPFWFLLAGIGLGISLLTYQGAFLPALAALALTAGQLRLDAPFRRRALASVAFLPLGVLIGALPLLVASHLDPTYATARVSSVSITHEYADWAHLLPALLHTLQRHALIFTVSGDLNGRHDLPGAPMLDPLTGTLFLLGLGICLRHISHWFYALLLLWLGASLLGGVLSLAGDAPHAARSIGALVPAALIAALPLAAAIRLAHRPPYPTVPCPTAPRLSDPATRRRFLAGTLAATTLLIAFTALNVDRYFDRQASNLQSWTAMGGQLALVGRAAAASIHAGYSVRVDPLLGGDRVFQYPVLRFDAGSDLAILDPAHPVPDPLPPGGIALIIAADDTALYRRLHHAYPAAPFQALSPAFDPGAVQAWVLLLR